MADRLTSHNRYSRWDGSQKQELDADDILEAISEDLMEFGDLQQAMRYLMQRGMDTADGNYIRGLRDLLRQLKDQRNQRLERYDMGSVMEDIKRQLEEILQMERESIDDWMNQDESANESRKFMDDLMEDLNQNLNKDFDKNEGGQPQGDTQPAGESGEENNFSNRLLGDIGKQNKEFIDSLPEDAAGKDFFR